MVCRGIKENLANKSELQPMFRVSTVHPDSVWALLTSAGMLQ